MYPPNNKHSDPQIKTITENMAAMTMPTLYPSDISSGLSTINLASEASRSVSTTSTTKKRKRHISFFDGDGDDKPRPAITAIYDRATGSLVSVKTFEEERAEEEEEFQAWIAEKKAKKAEKKLIEDSKTKEQDMDEALDELLFNPLDIANLLGTQ